MFITLVNFLERHNNKGFLNPISLLNGYIQNSGERFISQAIDQFNEYKREQESQSATKIFLLFLASGIISGIVACTLNSILCRMKEFIFPAKTSSDKTVEVTAYENSLVEESKDSIISDPEYIKDIGAVYVDPVDFA